MWRMERWNSVLLGCLAAFGEGATYELKEVRGVDEKMVYGYAL